MFKGSCVALVTPFDKAGNVDEKKLRELVEFQISNKTAALVPCGTTGESATLSHEEHHLVLKVVIEQVKKRIPVIAGAGSNSTREAVDLARHAKNYGADAVLTIVPYYNKPTQKGMAAHFSAIEKEVGIPMVIYNIPSRTGVNMLPETIIKLLDQHKKIVGVKESSGDLNQATELAAATVGRDDFSVLSGDDFLTLPMLAVGGKGVISVLANIAPKDCAELCSSYFAGNMKRAQELHWKMYPLTKSLFIETNPAPVKTAMELMGLATDTVRLPMVPLSPGNKQKLENELKNYGLIK